MRSGLRAPLLLLPILLVAGTLALPAPPPRPGLAAVAAASGGLWSAALPGAAGAGRDDAVPGELIVKFRAAASLRDKEDARGRVLANRRRRFAIGAEQWRLPAGASVPQAIERLRSDPRVAWAEPNYRLRALRAPTDPRYPEQWALHNTGQDQGHPGADIRAEAAWDAGTGSRDVVVAVIDTGIDYTHPDLAANIWDNEGEIGGNGIDDDGNGFVDDVRGWDFVNDDNDPFDDAGHGTHVAGIIGAAANNAEGITGIAWRVRLMPVKFLGADGGGSAADAVAAVEYATRMGARIMNNSWGGGGYSQALFEAIQAAAAADALFVAAAGNDGSNNDLIPTYPASYDVPNIVSVAATDRFDHLAGFSNYGEGSVDLAAPGVEILSTVPGARYAVHSGTSMATPHVSGVAALMRAASPSIDALTLRRRLLTQVDPLPGLAGAVATGGRLDAALAMASPDAVPPAPITDLAVAATSSNTVTLAWTAPGDDGDQGKAQSYDLRYATFPIDASVFDQATPFAAVKAPAAPGTHETVEVTGLLASTDYSFAVRARDEWGNPGALGESVVGTTLPPPRLATAPASFSADLRTGQSESRTLTIANAGDGTLDWSIPPPRIGPAGPGLKATGGPDPFGYRFIDSDEPAGPVFAWTDLRLDGVDTGLAGDDTISGPIPLGFSFPFYEDRFDAVRICSNGFLSFTGTSTPYANLPLPNQGAPSNLVAPFWDDLFLIPTSKVVYRRDPGRFRVQYDDVMHYDGSGPDTFQVELRDTGEIEFRYRRLEGTRVSATAGIQDAARSRGLQIVFNAPYLHDDLAVHIDAVPQWLGATPVRGRLGPRESADVTVGIDATALPGGAYEGSVLVQSNDPDAPLVEHPVTLRVTDAPSIAVSPPAVDFGTVFAGFASQQLVTLRNVGTRTMTVSAAGSSAPAVTVVGTPVSIEPGETADLTVIWSPALPAALDATLLITSDAANRPQWTVPLGGAAIATPSIGVAPAAFVETLDSGGAASRTLTLTNSGATPLDFRLRALAGPAGVSAGSSAAVFDRLADSPQPVACLAGDDEAGLIYCQENQGSGFLRLRLTGGTWEPLAPAPFAPGEDAGAAILGGRIYASWAGKNAQIGVYDIAARTWTTRANPLGLGTAAIAGDGARWLYLIGATTFVRYDPSSGAVETLPAPPFVFGMRGGLRYRDGSLYGHAGGGSTGFGRYDVATRAWESLAPIPGGGGLGAAIDPWSGEYATAATGGRGVARYAFGARAWTITPVPLFATGDGGLAWMSSPAPGLVIAQGHDGRQCARLSTAPGFLALGATSGRVPAAGSLGVAVRLDTAGLGAGDHRAALLVESNDPRAPAVTVPVSLTVIGAPDLRLLGDTITVESTRGYAGSGAVTTHTLALADPPGGGASLTLLAEGDYGDAGERAALGVEGIDLGSAGGTGADCSASSATFPLSDAQLAALAADGRVVAQVRNTGDVGDLCGVNRHTVRLTYQAAVDRIDFGEVFTATTRGRAVVLANQGTAPLHITSITAEPSRFAPALGEATLAEGETLRLEVRVTPVVAGSITGSLRIASDDPDQPLVVVPLAATGAPAPRAAAQPVSIARTLRTNQAAVETVTLANAGGGPLHFSVEQRATADAPACRPTRLLATQAATGALASIDLLTGAVAPLASGLAGPTVGIDVDARAGVAYVAASDRGTIEAVDLATGASRTVAAGFSYPYGVALDAARGLLFVNDGAPGTIVEVDLATGAQTTRAGGLSGAADLALAPGGAALYVADTVAGRLLRMDTATGVLTTLAFGLGTAYGLAIDADGGRLLVTVGDPGPGRLLAVDLAGGGVRTLATGLERPYGVALSPARDVAWVAEQGPDRVSAIDLATGAASVVAAVPGDPVGLVLEPDPRCRVDFLGVAPSSGVVPPGGAAAIEVRLDATALGSGAYDGVVAVTTDDPAAPSIGLPVRLTVTGAPDLVISGEEVRLQSSALWSGAGAVTTHDFRIDVPPGDGATFLLDADGDYGSAAETATLEVEGSVLGSAGGVENDCQPAHATLALSPAALAAAAADGVVHVVVRNSADVNQVCLLSRHTVRMIYDAPGDRVDFGVVRIGADATRTLTLANRGTDPLTVASIASDTAAFTVAPEGLSIEPGGERVVTVRFTPSVVGQVEGTIAVRSDDPDQPIAIVPVLGAGRVAPEAGIDPPAVAVSLVTGETATRTLTLRNTGGSDLAFSAALVPPAGAGPARAGPPPAGRTTFAGSTIPAGRAPAPIEAAAAADTLLVQDLFPWGKDTDADVLSKSGARFARSTAAALATADLSPYRMILVAGDQQTPFYTALAAAMPRVADWVAEGGVLEFHGAAWGTNAGDASGVVLPGGVHIEQALAPANTLLQAGHPLVFGLPDPFTAHWASHAHFRGLPPGAQLVAADDGGVTTLAVYRHGVGAVIAAGQPLEFYRAQANPIGAILVNAVGWARAVLTQPWLEAAPRSGVVPPGGTAAITLTFRPGLLPAGAYAASLALATNDPAHPGLEIPVALSVAGAPRLALLGEEETVVTDRFFNAGGGAATTHDALLPAPPAGGAILQVVANGDFGGITEYAEVKVEGVVLGRVGGNGLDCAPNYEVFSLTPAQMSVFAADGRFDAEVRNSFDVDATCLVNEHTLTLTYNARADRLDFGSLPERASATRRLTLANVGTERLTVTMSAAGEGFDVTPAGGVIEAGGRLAVDVRFTAGAIGNAVGTLTVRSDDPAQPTSTVALAGSALGAPEAQVSPAALSLILNAGIETSRDLTLSNTGRGDLSWTVTTLYDAEGGTVVPFVRLSTGVGVLPPAGSAVITLRLSTTGLSGGDHRATIMVASNDPVRPAIAIPVTLTIVPGGHVQMDTAELDFGGLFAGQARTLPLVIGDVGSDPLHVVVASIDPPFTVTPDHLEIPPQGNAPLLVTFTAPATGYFTGHLSLGTDDPLLPTVDVPLAASVEVSAKIGVPTSAIATTIPRDAQADVTFPIRNDGDAPLSYSTSATVPQAWCPARNAYYAEYTSQGINRVSLEFGTLSPVVAQRFTSKLGLVLNPDGTFAWATDYVNGRLVRVDLATRSVQTLATAFVSPVGLAVDPDAGIAYVAEYGTGTVKAFNFATQVRETIATDLTLVTGLALSFDRAWLYAATETGSIAEIDLAHRTVRTIQSGRSAPYGLAVTRDRSRVYFVEAIGGRVMVLDPATGDPATQVACCVSTPYGIVLDNDERRAFVTGLGSIVSVDLATGLITTISAQPLRPTGIAIAPDPTCSDQHMVVTPAGGVVPPGGATTLTAHLNTTAAPAGSYQVWVNVQSNDPVTSQVQVPIAVTVVIDTDKDGRLDPDDNCPAVANPDQADVDGDGHGDVCDLCPSVADPAQADADRDGIGDLCDPCTDTDRDGLRNPGFPGSGCGLDNCPTLANPLQEDADGDGAGDLCDGCTDPDHDGAGNPEYPGRDCPMDNCPGIPDPTQADSDGDGRGDVCDVCPFDASDDVDHDGACADRDNCPIRPNPDQADADLDGLGDLCDNCPATVNPDQGDLDRDGRGDRCDGCPTIADDGSEDQDGDGVGDRCDNCPLAANPDQADANHDRSGDACQPRVIVESIRQAGDRVTVRASALDPQGDPLTGEVDLFAGFGGKVLLTDALNNNDCALAWLPDGITGRGIAFANGSIGEPALLDADLVLGCDNFAPDWMLATGPCAAPTSLFDPILPLTGLPLPASICLLSLDGSGRTLDVTVLGYDDAHLSLRYGGESLPQRQAFAGRLPRSLDLTAFAEGTVVRVQITATDGTTPPVSGDATFTSRGERILTFGEPPVAAIAAAPATECDAPDGGLVRLDGRGSTDPDDASAPDGGIARFAWSEDPGGPAERPLGEGAVLDVRLAPGGHRVGLLVTDADGETGLATADVAVTDSTPPAIACPAEVVAECAGPDGAVVTPVAGASDACGAVSLTNDRDAGGGSAAGTYPPGSTPVTFTATDASGHAATCATRVVVRDTVAPALSLRVEPAFLWPANRRLVPVKVSWQSADRCTPAPVVTLVAVESSDPDVTGRGDPGGDVEGAVPGQPVTALRLRAERILGRPARTYTLRYVARDAAGNATPGTAVVTVRSPASGTR